MYNPKWGEIRMSTRFRKQRSNETDITMRTCRSPYTIVYRLRKNGLGNNKQKKFSPPRRFVVATDAISRTHVWYGALQV